MASTLLLLPVLLLPLLATVGAQIKDGQLEVELVPFCDKDFDGHRSFILRCGEFVSRPDFDASWHTPWSAAPVASHNYNGGKFHLVVPVGAGVMGEYSCKVPSSHQGQPAHEAALTVRGRDLADTECRLDLMEAGQEHQEAVQEQLKADRDELKAEVARAKQFQSVLVTGVTNTAPGMDDVLKFANVKYGWGYDTSTGKFTAAYSGAYLFTCTLRARTVKGERWAVGAKLLVKGNTVIHSSSSADGDVKDKYYDRQSVSLAGVVHLAAGDEVWATAYQDMDMTSYDFSATFSAALLSSE